MGTNRFSLFFASSYALYKFLYFFRCFWYLLRCCVHWTPVKSTYQVFTCFCGFGQCFIICTTFFLNIFYYIIRMLDLHSNDNYYHRKKQNTHNLAFDVPPQKSQGPIAFLLVLNFSSSCHRTTSVSQTIDVSQKLMHCVFSLYRQTYHGIEQ